MKKTNILLITSDQQHYSMLGAVNDKIKTPNLDRLAEEGMLFDRAYCSNPTCSPSRASVLTGMYPSEHGAWTLGTKLPETTPTLPGYLHEYGYKTALIGKAHFQPTKSTPEYPSLEVPELAGDFEFWKNFKDDFYGFDHIELLRNHTAERLVGQHYAMWMEEKGFKNWRDYFFKPTGKMPYKRMGRWGIPEEYHYNTWIAERTNAMLEEYKKDDKPFFLWASFPDPHYPQLVPQPWDKMYDPKDMELQKFSFKEHKKNPPYFSEVFKLFPKLKPYRETGKYIHGLHTHLYLKNDLKRQIAYAYGMTSFMDKYIGKILDKLKELGLEENTLVVFTTDHGDLFGQHGFRHKCVFHYEDLLRVPMIVRYKDKIAPSGRSEALQSLVDLAPTFLSYCGLPVPECMSGVDQSKVWSGEEEKARINVVVENRHEPHTMNMRSYVEERYKMTVHEWRSYGEMYDLQTDPEEHDNLWGDAAYAKLKADLLFRFIVAECIKGLKPKAGDESPVDATQSVFVYQKEGYKLSIDTAQNSGSIYKTEGGKEIGKNLFDDEQCLSLKIDLLLSYLSSRMYAEPMWMPRICGA